MYHHLILRIISKLLIPPILLYGLYVQFHGDFGAGGGFQAGVIVAAAFVLFALVYDLTSLQRVLPPPLLLALMSAGVLIFAGTGLYSLFAGYNYLDYAALAPNADHDPQHGQHLGILLVEFGVGLTVASVMTGIFIAFAARPPTIKDEEW